MNYRAAILARINELVGGEEGFSRDSMRWGFVKELLYNGNKTKPRNRRNEYLQIKLSKLNELTDEQLLEIFEVIIVRRYMQIG